LNAGRAGLVYTGGMNENLLQKKCRPCAAGTPPMTEADARSQVAALPGWALQGGEISKTFEFKNFYQTMAFANAVAWIANREDHHPDMELSYKRCKVRYSTHSVGGLSENDFICAAKIEAIQS
jgi:4a-hydroxytetrahydrobiopterin dehydratase